jgi:hypothetical protein
MLAHVRMKWKALRPSMTKWCIAVPSATPPHLKKVTCEWRQAPELTMVGNPTQTNFVSPWPRSLSR